MKKWLRIQNCRGFTLLELMLVISVLVILSSISVDYYYSYLRSVEIEKEEAQLAVQLRQARDRAMSGESDRNWGIRITNGASDYYEIFSTPTDYSDPAKTVTDSFYLNSNVAFSDPSEGGSATIIFQKITGVTTGTAVSLSYLDLTETVSVAAFGSIDY